MISTGVPTAAASCRYTAANARGYTGKGVFAISGEEDCLDAPISANRLIGHTWSRSAAGFTSLPLRLKSPSRNRFPLAKSSVRAADGNKLERRRACEAVDRRPPSTGKGQPYRQTCDYPAPFAPVFNSRNCVTNCWGRRYLEGVLYPIKLAISPVNALQL